MAKRTGKLAEAMEEGNRKYVIYGVACFLCVAAGAYIGHSSQAQLEEQKFSAAHMDNGSEQDGLQTGQPLEIKYAYFGAPAIQMPSENVAIVTPKPASLEIEVQARNVTEESQPPPLEEVAERQQEMEYTLGNTVPSVETEAVVAAKPTAGTQIATVASGDSFSTIGQMYGLSVREAANIMRDKLASTHLKTIIPGEQITFKKNQAGKVDEIIYVVDDTRTLMLERLTEAKFSANLDEIALEKRIMVNMGAVENSLFLSAAEAGVSNRHIMQMVDIFRWDIDFAMDVQPNDTFKLVYEGYYKGEQLVRTGRLLGVEFKGRSTHQALFFEDKDGEGAYYTARGRQLQKQFLRNPVDTVRITSPFNLQRKHPVLNTIKAHKGVDYGAPIGTPIKATADGMVKYSGRRGTYGLTVILQHGKRYTTLYAHMNKIHKSTRVGKKVKQGEVIGYVGKTGRVTGAHLHYEFRVKGVHVNPQTVKFAGAGSVPEDQMRQFKTATSPIMQELTALDPNRFASSQ